MKGYDNIPENEDLLLDLPFYEGTGAITQDQAKPHHQDVILKNSPLWMATLPDGDLVTNGSFLLNTDDAGELSAGNLTLTKCYVISAQSTEDFTADGAFNNNVGTYFIATNNTVTLDINNKVFPVTIDDWSGYESSVKVGANYLEHKAYKGPSVASNLEQSTVVPEAGQTYDVFWRLTKVAGDAGDGITVELGSTEGTLRTTSGTYLDRIIATDTDFLKFKQTDANANLEVTIDNISCGVPLLGVIHFNGDSQYLELDGAACADLDFTSEDYSVGGWMKWSNNEPSQILIARYVVSTNGWEIYLTEYGGGLSLTLRHHHAGGGSTRSGVYSYSWPQDEWCLFGISRSGTSSIHYRNGVALASIGSLEDPEACNQDLTIGVRYTKNANFLYGSMWRPRIWSRSLSASEWMNIFETERAWFGV